MPGRQTSGGRPGARGSGGRGSGAWGSGGRGSGAWGPGGPRWIAAAVVAVLAVAVLVLAVLALQRARPDIPALTAPPAPTFAYGDRTASPTPRPSPSPSPAPKPPPPRSAERFLSANATSLLRAVAGACGGSGPVIERSTDGGRTWEDVTPRYQRIAQVASLDAITDGGELVGGFTSSCRTLAMRSFTYGQFWESYPDVLRVSRFIDLADASVIHLGATTVDAPCPDARGLRAAGDTVAVVCDGAAYVRADAAWSPLVDHGAVAVAVRGGAVVVARTAAGCDGLVLTGFADAAGGDAKGSRLGCAQGANASGAVAVVTSGDGYLVWAGTALVRVG